MWRRSPNSVDDQTVCERSSYDNEKLESLHGVEPHVNKVWCNSQVEPGLCLPCTLSADFIEEIKDVFERAPGCDKGVTGARLKNHMSNHITKVYEPCPDLAFSFLLSISSFRARSPHGRCYSSPA